MSDKTAVVFPGQGSQKVGMLNELVSSFAPIKKLFEQASTVLNYDLWKIVSEGPEEILNQTIHTQPAMLVADFAFWTIFREVNPDIKVDLLAGHSLGEYAALVAAEALSFDDGVKLMSERARCMQEAVPSGKGAMGVILNLSSEEVEEICKEVSTAEEGVTPANYNAPGQMVVAGTVVAVDKVLVLAKEKGARRAMKLPMSVPSHSPLMQPASEKLAEALNRVTIQVPRIPVIQNADLKTHDQPEAIKKALVQQLYNPVRWVETIQYLSDQGVQTVIECGPGKILTGLNKRIDSAIKLIPLCELADLKVI